MKKDKVLFDSSDFSCPDEEFINAYIEEFGCEDGMLEAYAEEESLHFEIVLNDLQVALKDVAMFKANGTLGLWNRTAKFVAANENIVSLIHLLTLQCCPSYIRIYINNGNLMVDAVHHDGQNHFVIYDFSTRRIRKLFNKGDKYEAIHFRRETT